jgi:hypothetical protein
MVIQVILSDLHSTSNISFSEKRAQSFSINGINGMVIIPKKQYLVRSPKYICVFRCYSVFMSCFLPRLWPIPGLVIAHLGRNQHCRHGRKTQPALPQPST